MTFIVSKLGRPTKLTPELAEAIFRFIRSGVPYEFAAGGAGISEPTLYNWINRGEADIEKGDDQSVYANFFKDIKKIRAETCLGFMSKITGLNKNWQGCAWALERNPQYRKVFAVQNQEFEELKKRFEDLENKIVQAIEGEKGANVMASKQSFSKAIKKGKEEGTIREGGLHRSLHKAKGEKISHAAKEKAAHSSNPKVKKQGVLALNFEKMSNKKKK